MSYFWAGHDLKRWRSFAANLYCREKNLKHKRRSFPMSCRIEKEWKKEDYNLKVCRRGGGGGRGWEVLQLNEENEEEFMKCLILIRRIVLQLCDLWHWFGGLAASSGLLTWPPLTPIFITCRFKYLLGIQSNSAIEISAFRNSALSPIRHKGFRHSAPFGIQSHSWFKNSAFSPIRGSGFQHSGFVIQEFGILSFGIESVNPCSPCSFLSQNRTLGIQLACMCVGFRKQNKVSSFSSSLKGICRRGRSHGVPNMNHGN